MKRKEADATKAQSLSSRAHRYQDREKTEKNKERRLQYEQKCTSNPEWHEKRKQDQKDVYQNKKKESSQQLMGI